MLNIKNKASRIILILFCGTIFFSSCSKKLDTNLTNPNGVPIYDLSPKDLFEQALVATVTNKVGANVSTASTNYQFTQEWMGYLARQSGWSAAGLGAHIESYALTFSDADGTWESLYHNIYDYNYIMTDSIPHSILPGAARLMRAMVFQDLVDQFGNIPYFQACEPFVTKTPQYDSATIIYKNIILQIDSSITEINASQATDEDSYDIIFKGNKSLWLAFANTLKLRVLLRQVPNFYRPNDPYIGSELGNVTSQGGFLGLNQDVQINPGFADANQQQSPFWADYGFLPGANYTSGTPQQNYQYYGANNIMLDTLETTSDPRIGYFYYKSQSDDFIGNDEGTGLVLASNIGSGILQDAGMPALLFSASQSLFMQAEAAQRGMISGDAATFYKQAVEESFRYLGISDYKTSADNFVSSSKKASVNFSLSSDPLGTILTQKWIAECELDPLEAYCDYRRTGLPAIYGRNSPNVPQKRLLYPESEFINNSTNVNAQGSEVTSQSYASIKLFWGL